MILSISSNSSLAKAFNKFSKEEIIKTYYKKKIYPNSIYFKLGKTNIESIIKKRKIKYCLIYITLKNSNFKNQKKIEKFTFDFLGLIRKLIKHKIPFIFFSSESIYEGLTKNNHKENKRLNPKSPYAKHKYIIENFINNNAKYFTILRLGRAYNFTRSKQNFLSLIIDQMFKNKKNFISFASDYTFSPINIHDLNKITQIIISKKIFGIYNLSGDERLSYYEIAKKINKFLKKKNKVNLKKKSIKDFSKFTMPGSITMNNQKIKKKIKFQFSKVDSAIKKYILLNNR